jgi:hypothetical protein
MANGIGQLVHADVLNLVLRRQALLLIGHVRRRM